MEQALYHPEHGYYASGRARIGRKGDFFTNVSVGPLFGRLLARQFEEIWNSLGRPDRFTLVEQGAASGDFAADVCRAATGAFRAALDYVIVEPFPRLQEGQETALRGLPVRWLDSLEALEPFTGVHFSNELLDAMPVHLVVFRGGEWRERYVKSVGEDLVFEDGPVSSEALARQLRRVAPPEIEGYATEINLEALCWLESLAPRLLRGAILIVDYGYPAAEYFASSRHEGTLMAFAEHQAIRDPLRRPGEQDLTTHVEFSSLATGAHELGLKIAGFTDQHHFMVGLGRDEFSDGADASARAQELRAFKSLMHPGLMGLSFKYLAFTRELPGPLAGFAFARPTKL